MVCGILGSRLVHQRVHELSRQPVVLTWKRVHIVCKKELFLEKQQQRPTHSREAAGNPFR